MSVDTRQKRFGLMNVSMPWRGTAHPLVSGVDADERAVNIFMYGGIALSGAAVITDNRTAAGRVIIALASGDKIRLRTIRTDGSDDLQTISQGSAMTGVVFRN